MQVQTTLARAPWPWYGPYPQPVEQIKSFLTDQKCAGEWTIKNDLKIESALDGKTATSFELIEITQMEPKTIRGKLNKWVAEGKVICMNPEGRIDHRNNPFIYTLATGGNHG